MPLLEAKGITMRFGGLTAVDQVSFSVEQGQVVSIIGPNGAGKTTIFNILTGIYPGHEGEILFDGVRLNGKSPQEIVRLGISRTFQNIRLFSDMRVVENVLVGAHVHTEYSFFDALFRSKHFLREEHKAKARAMELLKEISLSERTHDYADSLPYGEQRRLEIARAIATGARLILLDEPAAGMNPQESASLRQFILELKQQGFTILLIEHDMKVVMNSSDYIYVIDYGKKIAEGTPSEILKNERVTKAYLGEGRANA